MTSHTDEIANLRASLEHIRQWCDHNVTYGNDAAIIEVCQTVRAMAVRGLKTPRASKVFTVCVGDSPAPTPIPDPEEARLVAAVQEAGIDGGILTSDAIEALLAYQKETKSQYRPMLLDHPSRQERHEAEQNPDFDPEDHLP